MQMNFGNSRTRENLMRAFAGESQARNRYTFAASQAKQNKLHVIEAVFTFTANQEKEHAQIFYNHLSQAAGENILIDGKYPVDINPEVVNLLKLAHHNEYEEYEIVYPEFGRIAEEEGYPEVAFSFKQIANIEKCHGDRFACLAQLLETKQLFVSDVETEWMCLNCGHIHKGTQAPTTCPVCSHDQGYFIRLSLAPYTNC